MVRCYLPRHTGAWSNVVLYVGNRVPLNRTKNDLYFDSESCWEQGLFFRKMNRNLHIKTSKHQNIMKSRTEIENTITEKQTHSWNVAKVYRASARPPIARYMISLWRQALFNLESEDFLGLLRQTCHLCVSIGPAWGLPKGQTWLRRDLYLATTILIGDWG